MKKSPLNHFLIVRKFLIILIFFLPTISWSQTQKLYTDFLSARQDCGSCLNNIDEAQIKTYREKLKGIKLALSKSNPGIDKDLLNLLIAGEDLSCATHLYKLKRIRTASLVKLIEDLNDKRYPFSNRSLFFDKATNFNGWKQDHYSALGVSSFYEEEDKRIIWEQISTSLDEYRNAAEDVIYERLTPHKSLLEIEYFLDNCSYEQGKYNNNYNHNADDAFKIFYQNLTFTGDPIDFEMFQAMVQAKTQSHDAFWISVQGAEWYRNMYTKDLTRANELTGIMNQEQVSDNDLRYVIQAGAPWEISLVALQKLISTYINSNKFDAAVNEVKKYEKLFSYDTAPVFTRKKYIGIIDVLTKAKTQRIQLNQVDGLCQFEKNEIRIISNSEGSLIALEPPTSGNVEVYNRDKNTDNCTYKLKRKISLSGAYLYMFEEKNKTKLGELLEVSRNNYQFGERLNIKASECYDFNVNENIIFFCSYSSHMRMVKKDNEDDTLNVEYASPGFVSSAIKVTELNSEKGYHGRKSGNPNWDIYYMVRGVDDIWSEPKLLLGVNTPFCERSPVLDKDGEKLYFSSEGWAGFGGIDIFYTSIIVDRKKKTISVTDRVHNLTSINTTFDDLYCTPVGTDGKLYVSSNFRDGVDFDIYYISKPPKAERGNSTPITPNAPSSTDPTPNGVFEMSDGIYYDVTCDWDNNEYQNSQGVPNGGRILVTGRIYDSQKRPYKCARIIFREYATNKRFSDTIDCSSENKTYQVRLLENARYHVSVFGYDGERPVADGFSDEYVVICPTKPKEVNIVKKDFVLNDVDSILDYGTDLELVFFFDFNQFDYSISNERLIINALKDIQSRLASRPNMGIKLIGFADTIGNATTNKILSENRVRYAANYLQKNGIKMNTAEDPYGESTHFNNQAVNNPYLGRVMYQHLWEQLKTPDERQRQMNRRVELRIIGL
jgi:outer membrane protein OmpA-like peptidoglycan-associated protein